MKKNGYQRSVYAIVLVSLLLAAAAAGILMYDLGQHKAYQQREEQWSSAVLARGVSSIESALSERIVLLGSVRSYVQSKLNSASELSADSFEAFTSELIGDERDILSISIHRYSDRTISAGPDAVKGESLPEAQILLEGDRDTDRQGRLYTLSAPIFHPDDSLWGHVLIHFDMGLLLEDAGISRQIEIIDEQGVLLQGSEGLSGDALIEKELALHGQLWTVRAYPAEGDVTPSRAGLLSPLGALVLLLFSLLILMMLLALRSMRRSELAARRKTEDLRKEVSEHRQLRAWLSDEKDLLTATLGCIQEAVCIFDEQTRLIDLNEAAKRFLGDHSLGKESKDILKLQDDRNGNPIADPVKTVQINGFPYELRSHCLASTFEGQRIPVSIHAAPVVGDSASPSAVVLIVHDLCDEMQHFEQLQRNAKLESLGVLAAGIAHDFNNLLSGVYGFIELAKARCEDDPQTSMYLERSLESYDRAASLTSQLLTFTKGETPRKGLHDITSMCREVIERTVSSDEVSLSCHIEPGLWPCRFDQQQVSSAIGHILENAEYSVKQVQSGKRDISVSVRNAMVQGDEEALATGNYICITIEDTGVGIPEEHMKQIFDPFFSTWHIGSGLGLTTAYSIIRKHQGDIMVHSSETQGTSMSIYLPAMNQQYRSLPSESPGAETNADTPAILVMDDEPQIRQILSEMLAELGYRVETAEHGQKAIDLCREAISSDRGYAMIICDLTVTQGLGGLEIIDELRELFPDAVIIASSGYSRDPVLAEPKRFGFDASLPKPYRYVDLADMLRRTRR